MSYWSDEGSAHERHGYQRYLVTVGSQLGVTKRWHRDEYGAFREVANRLGGLDAVGWDRWKDVGHARPLTTELESAYKALVAESTVAYRRQARESVKAQATGQDQLLVAA